MSLFRLKSFWSRVTNRSDNENLDDVLDKAVENLEYRERHHEINDDDGEGEQWPRLYETDADSTPIVPINPFPETIGFWRPF